MLVGIIFMEIVLVGQAVTMKLIFVAMVYGIAALSCCQVVILFVTTKLANYLLIDCLQQENLSIIWYFYCVLVPPHLAIQHL